MSSQLGGVVVMGPRLFLETSKITAGKLSVGKSIVQHEKLKHHSYTHTFSEEYVIDKKGMYLFWKSHRGTQTSIVHLFFLWKGTERMNFLLCSLP